MASAANISEFAIGPKVAFNDTISETSFVAVLHELRSRALEHNWLRRHRTLGQALEAVADGELGPITLLDQTTTDPSSPKKCDSITESL